MSDVDPTMPDDPPSIKRTLLGASLLSLQPLILNALSVPALGYIIVRLGSEGYGQWMIAAALLAVCASFSSLGLRGAFIRRLAADRTATTSALAEQLALRTILGCCAGAVAVGISLLLGYNAVVVSCAAIGALGLMLSSYATTLADLFHATGRLHTVAAVNVIAGIALTLASVLAAWRAPAPAVVALAYLVGPLVAAILFSVLLRRLAVTIGMRCTVAQAIALLRGSRHLAFQQLVAAGSSHAEALLLPGLVGPQTFGVFSAGTLPTNRLVAFPDGICTATYPQIARRARNGVARARSLVFGYAALSVAGALAMAVVVFLCARPLGQLLLPSDVELFTLVVRVTIWALPIAAIDLALSYALNAVGHDAAHARASLCGAVTSLVVSVGLVGSFGLVGACWSVVLRPAIRAAFLVPIFLTAFGRAADAEGAADHARSEEAALGAR